MDVHLTLASRAGQKRTAEEDSPPLPSSNNSLSNSPTSPHILRRYQHRRAPPAALIWGPDIPSTIASTPSITSSTRAGSSVASHPRFNIYKVLLRHPNLFFQFALRLPYPTILSLYAIDKEFHYRLNKYSVSLIHDYAKYHAPLAGWVFSWVLFPELCISDPMLRPMDGRAWLARDVPGFRWVGMVLWRQYVVRAILTLLGVEGHRVPQGVEGTLMKYWVLMEMRSIAVREAFLRDKNIWTDADLFNFQAFLVKLDMRFANPVLGNGVCELGRLLLTQKSLSMLWMVLTGKISLDYDKTTDLVVRTYLTEDLDVDTHMWLDDEIENGVPEEWWGILSREGWHMDGARMESAVDMVITEGLRRGLNVQQWYLDFVLYGYVDSQAENVPAPRQLREGTTAVLPNQAWPKKAVRESTVAILDNKLGIASNGKVEAMHTSAWL
jgi:hypothetical protein